MKSSGSGWVKKTDCKQNQKHIERSTPVYAVLFHLLPMTPAASRVVFLNMTCMHETAFGIGEGICSPRIGEIVAVF
jgi:hypothetical protein